MGWGMSIASKQAKERQKRTPDELVMVKTVKHRWLKSHGPDIRGFGPEVRDLMSRTAHEIALQEPDVRATGRMSGLRAGCPGSKSEDELEELDFGGGN